MTAVATSGIPLRIRSRTLGPLVAVFLAVGLSTALSFPFLGLFLTSAVHAGPIELSAFLLAQPLSGVVVSTVLGRLSDGRVARRRVLMVSATAGCASAALFSVLRSYWPLLVLACTVTAVGGALLPQGFAYARAFLVNEPTAPMITATLRTFFSLSWVAGPPLASLLLNAGGFTTLYACSSGLYALVVIVVARWMVEPPAVAQASTHAEKIDVDLPIDGARRSLWITLVGLVLLQSASVLNVQALPLLVRHNLHSGVGAAGVILGICAALEIPAMLELRRPVQAGAPTAAGTDGSAVRHGLLRDCRCRPAGVAARRCTGAQCVLHSSSPGPGNQLHTRTAAVAARSRVDAVQQHIRVRCDLRRTAAGLRREVRLPLLLHLGGRTRRCWTCAPDSRPSITAKASRSQPDG